MPRLLGPAAVLLALAFAAPAAAQTPPPPAPPAVPPPPAAPAPPAEKRIAPGVRVAGIDVGALTLAEAAARLQPALATPLSQPVVVAVAGRRFTLTPKAMRLEFDALRSARRAYNTGKKTPPAAGAFADVAPYVTFRRGAVRDFANRIDRRVTVAPRDATVRITVKRIVRKRSRAGRNFNARALRSSIEKLLVDPAAPRLLKPGRTAVKANVTANELAGRYATVITIDRANFKLRLFKRLKLVRTYGVAVGAAGYDTPRGMYSITNKAVNPAWSAPDKPWAGLYRGRVVPGGSPENPLKARWLGIVNGVGIHGTGDPGSIGSRASHGCIRMRVPEVIQLYDRVPIGTPVLIR
jgi:lipoprotein-anchoring transpeptidase ErfK/SrfK